LAGRDCASCRHSVREARRRTAPICNITSIIGSIRFRQCKLCSFGDAVVERRTSTAALLSASAVASPSAGTCSGRHLVCSYIGCNSWRSSWIARRSAVILALAWCWTLLDWRDWLRVRAALQIHRSVLITCFDIKPTRITNSLASWRATPQRSLCCSAVTVTALAPCPHTCFPVAIQHPVAAP
jgi:hypothetical protein